MPKRPLAAVSLKWADPMEVRPTEIEGVVELVPKRHTDERGWFSEVWNQSTLRDLGVDIDWVQDNEARSVAAGTIRGIHYQLPPRAQAKLVRAARGELLDVAVDLRRSSPTFGAHVAVKLTESLGNQLLIPAGFGHGYCTLVPDVVISYKVNDFYDPTCDRTLSWNDPALSIEWPVATEAAVLSAKDLEAPGFESSGDHYFT